MISGYSNQVNSLWEEGFQIGDPQAKSNYCHRPCVWGGGSGERERREMGGSEGREKEGDGGVVEIQTVFG